MDFQYCTFPIMLCSFHKHQGSRQTTLPRQSRPLGDLLLNVRDSFRKKLPLFLSEWRSQRESTSLLGVPSDMLSHQKMKINTRKTARIYLACCAESAFLFFPLRFLPSLPKCLCDCTLESQKKQQGGGGRDGGWRNGWSKWGYNALPATHEGSLHGKTHMRMFRNV